VRHGYIEWRARWPQPGRGMFPALWLFTAAGAFNDPEGKGRSEIDVFEIFGHGAGRPFSGTLHLASNSLTPLEVVDLYARDVDTAGWHTYGLDWQPGHLRFFYDNYLIRQVTGRVAEWFTSPMDLRMNFSMNPPWGSAAQQSDASTPAVMTMDIDYVRVFEQK
jgi:beta-glucanase (GH16 family)